MLVSMNWLREWVAFDFAPDELASRLTMAGLEVDSLSKVSQCDERVVVGQVVSIKQHPELERIRTCTVNIGEESDIEVVCGAPNLSIGGKYPLALPGSVIGDTVVKEAEIHGTQSLGMLCSAAELEFGDARDQLLELDAGAPVGESVNTYLERDDTVLDLELTPNRADCLSIRGVAREIAIIANTSLKPNEVRSLPAQSDSRIAVQVQSPEDCPVFCRRMIDQVRPDAVTPDWMKERLQRVGLRAIHPIVDITNYVMIELGQPMHAFDTEIIDASEIIVRHSRAGEQLVLLDGESLELGAGMLLITDRSGPIALAGVMGGESSGIRDETSSIMLEAAFFSPHAVRRSVSKFAMHTDASHRFERGVDPSGQRAAIERASELIVKITGGVPGPTQQFSAEHLIETRSACHVRHARVNRVLGLNIARNEMQRILKAVNQSIKPDETGWTVVPPAYRFDLSEEHDQVEEVARIYGYDNVPSRTSLEPGLYRNLSEKTVSQAMVKDVLHALGYHEAITYSFVDPRLQKTLKPSSEGFELSNPLAENMSVMRTSLWPGLIGALLENYRRSQTSIRLYELGTVFLPDAEVNMLAALAFGQVHPLQWGMSQRKADFFDIKGDLERLFELTGKKDQLEFKSEQLEGLHPGCSAAIYLDGRKIGAAGQLHPELLDDISPSDSVYLFELEIETIFTRILSNYIAISRYPSVIRDLSLVISKQQQVSDLAASIRQSAGDDLESLCLFDVYYDVDAEAKYKSVAFRLTYRSDFRTLTDAEVDASINKILDSLANSYDARLRV